MASTSLWTLWLGRGLSPICDKSDYTGYEYLPQREPATVPQPCDGSLPRHRNTNRLVPVIGWGPPLVTGTVVYSLSHGRVFESWGSS